MPVDRVLEVAQSLYEKKHISYPRTDSRVLSTEVVPELPKILNGLYGQPAWRDAVVRIKDFGKLTVDAKSKRFVDDTKVTDHYAIIPTYQAADPEKLDGDAQKIYTLVVKRFLAIFYPPAEYNTVKVETVVDGECFTTSSKTLKSPGWKEIYETTAGKADDDVSDSPIHKLVKKESCNVTGYDLEERQTKPPSRFTDGTLILTMEKAGKYIENEELRAQIRTSGIGTSATRAGIIKKLASVGYMRIQPKTQVISPTDKGEAIVALVKLTAKELLSPALTASWEKGLNQVQTGETAEAEFLDKLEAYIGRIIDKVNRQGDVNIEQALARLNQRETQTGTGAAAARP
jgi:DNA topoisomerase-3